MTKVISSASAGLSCVDSFPTRSELIESSVEIKKPLKKVHFNIPLEIPGNELTLTAYTPRWVVASNRIKEWQQRVVQNCDSFKTKVNSNRDFCRSLRRLREERGSPPRLCPLTILLEESCSEVSSSVEFSFRPGIIQVSVSVARECRDRIVTKIKRTHAYESMSSFLAISDLTMESECIPLLSEVSSALDTYTPVEIISFTSNCESWNSSGKSSNSVPISGGAQTLKDFFSMAECATKWTFEGHDEHLETESAVTLKSHSPFIDIRSPGLGTFEILKDAKHPRSVEVNLQKFKS